MNPAFAKKQIGTHRKIIIKLYHGKSVTQKEVIAIVKESRLWESLTQKEKFDAINHALEITRLSPTEENIKATVGEVYSEME
jgi:ABC-type uncharacterized transport system ATPase subunit